MTVALWKHLPVASGDERLRADQPLGAGQLQQLVSNGTLAVRENSLRTLWNGIGGEVWRDLGVPGDVTTFPWDQDADGVLVIPALRCRVRRHGERDVWPVVVVKMRGRAPSGDELGLLVHVAPSVGYPNLLTGLHASATTSSTTLTTVEVQVQLEPDALGAYDVARDAPSPTGERGTCAEAVIYLGAWCTSGSSSTKGLVGNFSVYLAQP